MWKKDQNFNQAFNMDFMLTGIIFLILGGIVFKWTILLAFVMMFFGYFLLNTLYEQQLARKLLMDNKRKTIRLFPGDHMEIQFVFENKAVFPYLNGVFRFQSGPSITSTAYLHSHGNYLHTYEVPLTIAAKGKTKLLVPIQAQKRGVVNLRNIHFTFAHLTAFHMTALFYDAYYYQEILIYPKPQQVAGIDKLIKMNDGSAPANMTMFEDVQSRISVRDYQPGDPFVRINWAATAKTQELQTNAYENVVNKSCIFIVNIASNQSSIGSTSGCLEDLLGYTAYLCQYAYKNNLPFSMYINARKFGGTDRNRFVQLYEGEGSAHYMQSLDMLARIHTQGLVLPFDQMLMQIGSRLVQSETAVVIGETDGPSGELLAGWSRRAGGIYQVISKDAHPVLERFTAKGGIASGQ